MIHFLFGKEQAVFPHHNVAHYSARKPPAFKPHRPAAVRGTRFPSYKIINTFVAINKHQVRLRIAEFKFATHLIFQSAIDSAEPFGRELRVERLVAGRNLKSAIELSLAISQIDSNFHVSE
jgi:hypothetical protein